MLPNTIETVSPEEYFETIKTLYELLTKTDVTEADLQTIRGIVDHEAAHLKAFEDLDVASEDTVYGIWVKPRPPSTQQYWEQHSSLTTKIMYIPYAYARRVASTKLGIAAAVAAPLAPSDADISALQGMGYTGPEDVARRVIAHNKRSSLWLPVPKFARTPWFDREEL
jgi:hypothetical protein